MTPEVSNMETHAEKEFEEVRRVREEREAIRREETKFMGKRGAEENRTPDAIVGADVESADDEDNDTEHGLLRIGVENMAEMGRPLEERTEQSHMVLGREELAKATEKT
jgi:hypothetical protein